MSTFENSDTDHSDIDAQMRSDMSTMQARLSAVEKELESKREISQLKDKLIKMGETMSLGFKQINEQHKEIKELQEVIIEQQDAIEILQLEIRQLSSENAQLHGHPNPSEIVPLINYENTEPEYQQSNDNAPDDNQN